MSQPKIMNDIDGSLMAAFKRDAVSVTTNAERELVELLVQRGTMDLNDEAMDKAKGLIDQIRANRAPLDLLEEGLRKAIAYEAVRATWLDISQRLSHAGLDFGRVTAAKDTLERLIAERKAGG